jgi:hypothetical protein
VSADLLTRLIAAGTPADLVGEVALALATMQAEAKAQIDAALAPTKGALRTRRYRKRLASSQNVTCDASDAPVTENVTPAAPSPPPLLSPQTPQTTPPPLPHPDRSIAYTCEAARLVLAVVEAGCRAAIADRTARKARWPKDMPPPAGVSEEQWAGYIDHRKAKREHLTPRAYQLLSNKLAAHADDEWPPGRIIDHIVERGWTSFEPGWLHRTSENRNGKRTHHHDRPSGPIESRRRLREQLQVDAQRGDEPGGGYRALPAAGTV